MKKYGIIKDEKKVPEEVPDIVEEEPFQPKNEDEEDSWLDDHAEDDEFIRNYRNKRFLELQLQSSKKQFGEVIEITAVDYVKEVNQAGEDIWVVLLLYRLR